MPLPGTTVTLRDSAPPRSAPTDSSVWLVTGMTEHGPTGPKLIQSLADYQAIFGARVSYGLLYDSLETFFREGGSKAYVSRVFGPTPVKATGNLFDQAGSATPADVNMVATAKEYGTWGNFTVDVIAGSGGGLFKIRTTIGGVIVETSPDLADVPAAVAWSASSAYLTLVAGASAAEDPRVQTIVLAGGTDDHANALEAQWKAALDLFTADLGPGQVSAPGRTTDQSHLDLLNHASANRRIALVDAADTATVATLTAAAAALRASGRFGGMFAPWAVIPGLTAGTTRTVPYSAVEAGIIARNDGAGRSPNEAAAGVDGQSLFAVGLSQAAWLDTERQTLNEAGVNVARFMLGGVRTYGYRSLVDPAVDPRYQFLSASRLVMEIEALGLAIGERYVFGEIDGRGLLLADYAGELRAMLTGFYEQGSLYGRTPAEAFTVDVGVQVNPPANIASGIIAASIEARISPLGERVQLFITNRSITEVI